MTLEVFAFVCAFVVMPLAVVQLIVTTRMLKRERERARNRQILLAYLRRNEEPARS